MSRANLDATEISIAPRPAATINSPPCGRVTGVDGTRPNATRVEGSGAGKSLSWSIKATVARAGVGVCCPLRPCCDRCLIGIAPFHFTRLMILNIGMYNATTMPPTVAPMTTINSGSINDVSESTVAETSAS